MLEVSELSKTYPNGVQALKDVSLYIPRGMFGLLGPNGAGKSTLMRTLAALQDPDVGSLRFGDIDIRREPDQLRRVLGYLPQDFGVYPRVSALEMLSHLAILKGITDSRSRKQMVAALLHQTNLWEVRKSPLTSFSGGMRQRFGIAQALIGDPQLIIVDEPTAGLDPEERNRFHNLLSEIGEQVVVLLSTHIVDDVANLCPRMAIIADGRIVAAGSPADLIAPLQGKMWRKLVEPAEVEHHRARYEVVSSHLVSGRTALRVHSDEQPENAFEAVSANLEDVYFLTIRRTRAPKENSDTAGNAA